MKLLYHIATLRPQYPQAEAISQEIRVLQASFESQIAWINPNQRFQLHIPRLLFGLQQLPTIRKQEAEPIIHHLYNPDPFPFPYLRLLRRPVIYAITCGLGKRPPRRGFFSRLSMLAVTDERSLNQLRAWHFDNAMLVKPGIDTSHFHYVELPLQSEIRLLVASAPWTEAQFRSKGVDALLEAARQVRHLHLTFLWRGLLADSMMARVERLGLAKQVTVINRIVDVNTMLAGVHATINLATEPGIVKSYPHSLLDSLAAGKPVLVSQAIPMADYVAATNCGVVISEVTVEAILDGVERLARAYQAIQPQALIVGQRDFSLETMISSYEHLYQQALERA